MYRRTLFTVLTLLGGLEQAARAEFSICPGKDVGEIFGSYDVEAVVLGAKEAHLKGINGYYVLVLAGKGCDLWMGIGKLGYDRSKFGDEDSQLKSDLAKVYHLDESTVVTHEMTLVSESGKSSSMAFDFVFREPTEGVGKPKMPYGLWRYTDADWERSGMWGALRIKPRASTKSYPAFDVFTDCQAQVARTTSGQALASAVLCGNLKGQSTVMVATPGLEHLLYEHSGPPNVWPRMRITQLSTLPVSETQAHIRLQGYEVHIGGGIKGALEKVEVVLQTDGKSVKVLEGL